MNDFPIWHLIFLILIIPIAISSLSLAPFVPSKTKDLRRINKLCDLKPGNNFVEIGCGSARVSMYIAKNNPDVNVTGIELAYPLYFYSKIKAHFFGPKNLHIQFKNAFKYDFSKTNVAYIFGLDKSVSGKLLKKLEKELPKGAKYISYVFTVNNWKGNVYIDKPSKMDNKICVCEK